MTNSYKIVIKREERVPFSYIFFPSSLSVLKFSLLVYVDFFLASSSPFPSFFSSSSSHFYLMERGIEHRLSLLSTIFEVEEMTTNGLYISERRRNHLKNYRNEEPTIV